MLLDVIYPIIEYGFVLISTQEVVIFTFAPYFGVVGGIIMGFLGLIAGDTPMAVVPAMVACAAIGYYGKKYHWKAILIAPVVGLPICVMILQPIVTGQFSLEPLRFAFFNVLLAISLSVSIYSIHKRFIKRCR